MGDGHGDLKGSSQLFTRGFHGIEHSSGRLVAQGVHMQIKVGLIQLHNQLGQRVYAEQTPSPVSRCVVIVLQHVRGARFHYTIKENFQRIYFQVF